MDDMIHLINHEIGGYEPNKKSRFHEWSVKRFRNMTLFRICDNCRGIQGGGGRREEEDEENDEKKKKTERKNALKIKIETKMNEMRKIRRRRKVLLRS
jgi:hypothetical protein